MSDDVRGGEARPEVVSAVCECCGLTEECTPAYVEAVRGRFSGRWVCGLCGEAVEDEIGRAGRRLSTEEALVRHTSFRAARPPLNTAEPMIAAVRQLFRRSLDSPRAARSTPSSPRRGTVKDDGSDSTRRSLARSSSCLSTAAR
ncbi:hypothetical protein MUK42_00201 [Musa troglodytarum]|uniref:DUF1677 family protein n=1 Tax=Musa troglodytarum TaxID=320322 RepID=A0A9E7JSH4_9LILI|nr:hypothetical protein MUK42_00201 [Musa troglodytarum]